MKVLIQKEMYFFEISASTPLFIIILQHIR